MMRYILAALALLGSLLAASATSAQAASITVCEDKNLRGRCVTLRHGVTDLREWGISNRISSFRIDSGVWRVCTGLNFRGSCDRFSRSVMNLNGTPFQDAISSLRPVRGGQGNVEQNAIVVYALPGYRGRSWVFSDDISDLRAIGLNNQISSIRVLGGRWQICARTNFRDCVPIRGDIPDLRGSGFNNLISSLRQVSGGFGGGYGPGYEPPYGPGYPPGYPPSGYFEPSITLYQDSGYRGRSRTVTRDVPDLDTIEMNKSISSVRVRGGVWELCFRKGYRGGCLTVDRDIVNMQNLNANDAISSVRRIQ